MKNPSKPLRVCKRRPIRLRPRKRHFDEVDELDLDLDLDLLTLGPADENGAAK